MTYSTQEGRPIQIPLNALLAEAASWVCAEEPAEDPLSTVALEAQTCRLCELIARARHQADARLLRSLRLELLSARWALVRVRAGLSTGASMHTG